MGIQSLCERPMFIRATLQGFLSESRLIIIMIYPMGVQATTFDCPCFNETIYGRCTLEGEMAERSKAPD